MQIELNTEDAERLLVWLRHVPKQEQGYRVYFTKDMERVKDAINNALNGEVI